MGGGVYGDICIYNTTRDFEHTQEQALKIFKYGDPDFLSCIVFYNLGSVICLSTSRNLLTLETSILGLFICY